MNRLVLIRHGENRANLTKEFSHRLIDYPLTAKGKLQAEQTAASWQLHDEIIWAWATGDAEARFPEGENFIELVERVRGGIRNDV